MVKARRAGIEGGVMADRYEVHNDISRTWVVDTHERDRIISDVLLARRLNDAEQLREQLKAATRNEMIEEFCVHLESLPYHIKGVRLEMARMLRGRLKTREAAKEPSP